jgi:DNA-binding NarL/FixJ family response regulator
MPPVRILIVDDHELVRRGLRSILLTRPEWEICGEAADGSIAIEKARELKPDVVLLDITMPHMNGLDAARIIRRDVPRAKVIILSQYDESEMRSRALEAARRAMFPSRTPHANCSLRSSRLSAITIQLLPETFRCRKA